MIVNKGLQINDAFHKANLQPLGFLLFCYYMSYFSIVSRLNE